MSRLPGSIDQRKKEAVLEATAALVVRRGPAVSLGQIAKRSGVSKQTIYNYFDDKPGLFQALIESLAGSTECPVCAYPMAGAPASFLSGYAKILLEWLAQGRLAADLRAAISPEHPEPVHRIQGAGGIAVGPAMPVLVRVLAEAAHSGRLRIDDPEDAARQFLNLVMAGRFCGGFPANLETGLGADIQMAADACGRIFVQAYAAHVNDVDQVFIANRTVLAAGRAPGGHPIHPRKEASS